MNDNIDQELVQEYGLKIPGLATEYVLKLLERMVKHRVITPSGCWEWGQTRTKLGYGRTSIHLGSNNNRQVYTHRLSAAIWLGLDLDEPDQCALHHCDNPACFNPDHLWVGTQAENTQDRDRKGRARPGGREVTHKTKYTLRDRVQKSSRSAH